ncbi:MAG: acyltransferase family protein [Burkholderiaceae bacterium]
MSSGLAYRREIDGLRTVAVLPVVLFHAGVPGFGGGFVGVDVFFVISGYLITQILLNDIGSQSLSLARFYARRARRILPALFLVMAACLPAAWLILLPTDLADFGASVLATALFGSNLLFALRDGYFDSAAELNPMLHTWSLSVEEQFYLFFPALLWWLSRGSLRHWRTAAIATLALGSLLLASVQAAQASTAVFFLPHARAWELAIGSLIALYAGRGLRLDPHPRWRSVLAFLGLLAILGSVVFYDEQTPFPGLFALAPTLGAALVILYASPRDPVGRLLGTRPAVGIGLISYSLYLWHQPVFAFYRHVELEPSGGLAWALLIAGCVGLAFLSWRFVETPARHGARHLSIRRVLVLALAGSAVFTLAGWVLYAGAGFPARVAQSIGRLPAYEPDNRKLQVQTWTPLRTLQQNPRYKVAGNASDQVNRFSADARTIKVLVIGNSHAKDTFNMLYLNRERFPSFEFARYGLQMACLEPSSPLFASPSYQAADVILVSTRWSERTCPGSGARRPDLQGLDVLHARTQADGKRTVVASAAPEFELLHDKTIADVMILHHALLGHRGATPESPAQLAARINRRYHEARASRSQIDSTNAQLRQWARSHQVIVLDKERLMCDEASQRCLGVSDDLGKTLFDHSHYTLDGARRLGLRASELDWLAPVERLMRER